MDGHNPAGVNIPIAPPKMSNEQWFEIRRRAECQAWQRREVAVVGKDLRHHFEVGNEREWFERREYLREFLPRICGANLLPDPRRSIARKNQARHPLSPLATGQSLHYPQRVAQGTALALMIMDSRQSAVANLVRIGGETRSQISSEEFAHLLLIAGSLEPWKRRIRWQRRHARHRTPLASRSRERRHAFTRAITLLISSYLQGSRSPAPETR